MVFWRCSGSLWFSVSSENCSSRAHFSYALHVRDVSLFLGLLLPPHIHLSPECLSLFPRETESAFCKNIFLDEYVPMEKHHLMSIPINANKCIHQTLYLIYVRVERLNGGLIKAT